MPIGNKNINIAESRAAEACPYCQSNKFVKRGLRKNQLGAVQLYLCRNEECGRVFTAQDVKGRKFPLNLVIECLNYYNLGFNFQQTCSFVKQKFKVAPDPQTLSGWVEQYKSLCRFERMRPWAIKMYKPQDMVEVVTMAHRQIFRFRYHRAKTRLLLEEFGNRYFTPLKDYLDNVSSETPHQYFQQGERMSDIRSKFNKANMIVRAKNNYANRLASFVLQAVKLNKDRHDALQRFMLANDSCTVATEVPVYIRKEDIEHMQNTLGFVILEEGGIRIRGHAGEAKAISAAGRKGSKKPVVFPRLLTGHIDLVQVRNGSIHLLDYKPNAAKERPIEQLTWYALAMSRLTGLRLFDFKCGWFDEKNYYQFFPLHVVKKIQSKGTKRKQIVHFKDGTAVEVPQKNLEKVVIV
ncbi:hypothetical protein L6250_03215 [Candidatus Parcubacteria bacterium]|nr:hypothetical protein [Patescibacteria group bacterium]MCG2688617.1 hypothetical protein [Candidatus Parcubacteria bacterium]